MTEPLPPSARHRGRLTPAQVARRMFPPVAAVTAVGVVILLLLVLNSQPTPPGPGPGAVAQLPAVSAHSAPAPTMALPVSEPPATQPPVTQPSAAESSASATAASSASPAAVRAPVTVLNNSRRSGLAHRIADQVRAAGWSIRQVGNFRGRIRTTTAYYPPGGYAAAAALARRFPQIQRILPRFAGLPGAGLTLVVTRDWS